MKSWPHLSQTWLRSPCLPYPRTLGVHKTPLATMAATWHLVGSRKKVAFFLFPRNPPRAVGESSSVRALVCGYSWVLKLATGGGFQGCKVIVVSGNLFPLTKDLLVLGAARGGGGGVGTGGCPLWKKRLRGSLL